MWLPSLSLRQLLVLIRSQRAGWDKEPGNHMHPFGETDCSQAQNKVTWPQQAAPEAVNKASS